MRFASLAPLALALLAGSGLAQVRYDLGSPVLTDLWVDPLAGNDGDTGATRDHALRTVVEAWGRVPRGTTLSGTGYRLMLVRGRYPGEIVPLYWEERLGTRTCPVMIVSADGPGAAVLPNLELAASSYVYLMGLRIEAAGGDAVHVQTSHHVLVRDTTIVGLGNVQDYQGPQEALKVNQCQYVYLEDSDVSGAWDNAVDFVGVQYGHVVRNRIHRSVSWCIYLKGGSAHFLVEGNEIFDGGEGGFAMGQGTGFEFMVSPWLHYESYDLRFVNNVVHDIYGAGIAANGAYDALFAFNTLYRVGQRSHAIEVLHGGRTCDGDVARCSALLAAGGWGTTRVGGDEPIPCRNVYILNNVVYNPSGYQTQWQHFTIAGPRTPSTGSNIPSPSRVDDNLLIRGNLIWNGPADHPVGVGDPDLEARLLAENTINTVEPQLVDPAHGDFRPVAGGSVDVATTQPLPSFPGADLSSPPLAPAGPLANSVPLDRAGVSRGTNPPPGAYARAGSAPPSPAPGPVVTPPPPAPLPDLAGAWASLSASRRNRVWSLSAAVRVSNLGAAAAPPTTARAYLSADGTLDSSDRLIRELSLSGYAAGETRRVSWSVRLPRGVDPRGRRVLFVLDANGSVPESDETNDVVVSAPVR